VYEAATHTGARSEINGTAATVISAIGDYVAVRWSNGADIFAFAADLAEGRADSPRHPAGPRHRPVVWPGAVSRRVPPTRLTQKLCRLSASARRRSSSSASLAPIKPRRVG